MDQKQLVHMGHSDGPGLPVTKALCGTPLPNIGVRIKDITCEACKKEMERINAEISPPVEQKGSEPTEDELDEMDAIYKGRGEDGPG